MPVARKKGKFGFDGADYEIIISPTKGQKLNLQTVRTDRRSYFCEHVTSIVESEWRKLELDRGSLYINMLYRYEGVEFDGDDVCVSVSLTDYKEVYGTNIKNPNLYKLYGDAGLGNALGICCLVQFKDGLYPLFRRSQEVHELPGYFHLCAGHFEPCDGRCDVNPYTGIKKSSLRSLELAIALYHLYNL